MSKYDPLWAHIAKTGAERITLRFSDIETILSFPIDHSFLNCKKELRNYGYRVQTISLKEQTVVFISERSE